MGIVFSLGHVHGQRYSKNLLLEYLSSTATYVINTDGINYWATRHNGEIPDGMNGTNASDVIQSALDAVRDVGGGSVFIAPATYVIDTIYIHSNTELYGTPATILKASGSNLIIGRVQEGKTTNPISNIYIHDLVLDGINQATAGSGIVLGFGSNVTIENVVVKNTYNSGIAVQYFQGAIIRNNVLINTVRGGTYNTIYVTGVINEIHNQTTTIVSNNIINGSGNRGIYIETAYRSVVSNNIIHNTAGEGINIGASNYTTVADNEIYNAQNGIHIGGSSFVSVTGNTVTYSKRNGMVLNPSPSEGVYRSVTNCTITGNTIAYNSREGYGYDAIRINTAYSSLNVTGTIIMGNILVGDGTLQRTAVWEGYGDYNTIIGNNGLGNAHASIDFNINGPNTICVYNQGRYIPKGTPQEVSVLNGRLIETRLAMKQIWRGLAMVWLLSFLFVWPFLLPTVF